MPFDLDDEELEATRKFYQLDKIETEKNYNFTISEKYIFEENEIIDLRTLMKKCYYMSLKIQELEKKIKELEKRA